MSKFFRNKKRKTKIILQGEIAECGLTCLVMVAGSFGYEIGMRDARRLYQTSSRGATLTSLLSTANMMGLLALPMKAEIEYLSEVYCPCILHWNFNHFVVMDSVVKGRMRILDPARGEYELSIAEVSRHFTGVLIELKPAENFCKKKIC